MEDRVVRILPALIGEPHFGLAMVFDEAVPIRVAGAVDPCQRPVDRRPQFSQRVDIAGSLCVFARKHNEQRGRVDTAVI